MQPNAAPISGPNMKSITDKRTRAWRAVKHVAGEMKSQLGDNLTPGIQRRVERAAELAVLAAAARRAALSDPDSTDKITAAVRLENASERAWKAVSSLAKAKPAPGVQEYLMRGRA